MATKTKPQRPSAFTLGRDRFAKISEVEGIRTSDHQKEDFQRFDRQGLSHEERRRIIVRKYTPRA
jgi:hypothetical protein